MNKNSNPSEETITPVLRDVELVTKKLYSFGKRIFVGVIDQIRTLLLFLFRKFTILIVVGALAAISAFVYSNYRKNPYESYLIIKSNVNTWEQLASDVHYLNSLISNNQSDALSKLLRISEEEALSLGSMEIKPSATYSQKVGLIEKLNKHMDTSTLSKVDYNQMLQFEDMAFTESYIIMVKASIGSVFKKIEQPLLNYFESSPIIQEKLVRKRETLKSKKEMYAKKLNELDTLQKVINRAILTSAGSGYPKQTTSILLSDHPSGQQLSPIDVSEKYISYHKELVEIDETLKLFDRGYEIKSHLPPFGKKSGYTTWEKVGYSALFASSGAFLLLLLFQFLKKKPLDA